MKGMSEYGAVATKIKGMRARLLKTEDYARLAGSGSVRELVAILKTKPAYEKTLEDINPDQMRRAAFERQLNHSAISDIRKISCFLKKKQKSIVKVYEDIYDIRIINNAIRSVHNKYTEPLNLTDYSSLYEEKRQFDFDKVIRAQSMEEIIASLEGSKYYEPLVKVDELVEEPTLFDYETALSRFYFSDFWKQLNRIDSKFDKETLLSVHGIEIDFLNMMWIYRTKAYYNVPPAEIYKYIIPAYHKLTYAQVAKMMRAGNTEELMATICETHYKKFVDPGDPRSLARAYEIEMARAEAGERKKYPYSLAVIESYLYDKRNEIERIVHIAECVRYGYDQKEIMDSLNIV